ncbi:hypothetical protein, partial [Gemmatimonas sp.]|uniref:hypothetical protein n=1 Tax=Gemmatimonas sp. TaxID=1962908 RepID=UPI0037C162D9
QMNAYRKTVLGVASVVLAAGGWLLLCSPEPLVLNDDCAPSGWVNIWRERIQGQRFWQSQLAAVDAMIDAPREIRVARARAESISRPILESLRRSHDSLIASMPEIKFPQKRPSEVLREAADSLGNVEMMATFDSLLESRSRRLTLCRSGVAKRAGIRF